MKAWSGWVEIKFLLCDFRHQFALPDAVVLFCHLNKTTMKKNMGSADRVIRVILAAIVATLYFTNIISGTVAIVLLILASVFILTSLVSVCPLYLPFGLSTLRKKINAPH